ncbi:MAG: aminodeoxychorismate/anthranilate synthase component II [Bacteroidia bacterium]|nr:aminodeoxychorismate/anthranilate synthase component II [Bacteroidia bacterium]
MKVFVIDNYDSFTYNLVHLLEKAGCEDVVVKRNDAFSLDEAGEFDKILISPGPGIPSEAGKTLEVIREYGSHKSILGICLGHQAIGITYGARMINLNEPLHGISTPVRFLADDYLFKNCPSGIRVGHYHSWVIDDSSDELEIIAENKDGLIMSVRHKKYDVRGIQFHPESILTECGLQIIKNWINHMP